MIQTRFLFRSIEAIRGTLPAYFEVYAPGSIYNGIAKADSRLPALSTESTYLLHLQIDDAQLAFYNGPAGISPLNTVDLDALRTLASGLDAGADLSPFEAAPMTMQRAVTSSGLLDSKASSALPLPTGMSLSPSMPTPPPFPVTSPNSKL